MSVVISNSQFAKDGIHVTYSDNTSQNLTFADKTLTLDSGLSVTGGANITGGLSSTGSTCLSTLCVSGDATTSGQLNVTGLTSLGNTLTVTGATTLNNRLTVGGSSTLNGDASVGGTLSVDGAATLNSSLSVAAPSTFNNNLTISGATQVNNNFSASGDANVGGALNVTGISNLSGNTVIQGTLTANENATFAQNVTVTGNLTVLGANTAIDTTSLQIKDAAILVANGNVADTIQTGIQFQYKPEGETSALYAGLKRRAGTGEFVFFKDSTDQIELMNGPTVTQTVTSTDIKGEYFQYDVGTPKQVSLYGLTPYDTNPTYLAWSLLGSNDGTTWNAVDRRNEPCVGGDMNYKIYTIPNGPSVAYRYWRFIYEAMTSDRGDGNGYWFSTAFYMKDQNSQFISSVSGLASEAFHHSWYAGSDVDWSNVSPLSQRSDWPGAYGGNIGGAWDINHFFPGGPYSLPGNYYSGTVVTTVSITSGGTTGAAKSDIYAVLLADSFNSASDLKLKKNVVTIDRALDKLDAMRGVYHDWNDESNKEHAVGVIAQEVQTAFPELVHEGSDGYLSVNYPKLTAVLLQAIKELKALVLSK